METNGPTEEQQRRTQLAAYRREYWRQYYLKNRERVLEKNKERQKARYANNKEHALNNQKAYYQKNADNKRAERMEYYWSVEKGRPKTGRPKKMFEPTLVTYDRNVTLAFD